MFSFFDIAGEWQFQLGNRASREARRELARTAEGGCPYMFIAACRRLDLHDHHPFHRPSRSDNERTCRAGHGEFWFFDKFSLDLNGSLLHLPAAVRCRVGESRLGKQLINAHKDRYRAQTIFAKNVHIGRRILYSNRLAEPDVNL